MSNSLSSDLQAREHSLPIVSFTKSWLIWGCAALFYCYQFMLRGSSNVMADELMVAFQVDACSLGILAGWYYITYTILQIPAGTLMDYFKPRRVLTTAVIVCGLGTLLFSMADTLYVAAFGRALIGAGSAMGFLSCLKIGTLWFPSHKLSLIVGLTVLLGTVGGMSAGYPLAWLIEIYDWRYAMWLVALGGFFLAVLAWLVVRDTPPDHLEREILKSHGDTDIHLPQTGLITNIITVVKNPQSWLIALYGFLMYVPLSGFTDLWGTPYLMTAYQLEKPTAALVNTTLLAGLGLGSPSFSFLCNYLQSYKRSALIAAIGSFVFFSLLFYVPGLPLWLAIICLFSAGFFLSGQFLAFAMTCALNPLSASGTAGGFQNMICMLSGVLFMPLIGKLLDYTWQGHFENGIRVFTVGQFTFALSSITLVLFLACIIVLLIKETYLKD